MSPNGWWCVSAFTSRTPEKPASFKRVSALASPQSPRAMRRSYSVSMMDPPAECWLTLIVKALGAGEGNRTLVCSLGSCRSTIELRPQINDLACIARHFGGHLVDSHRPLRVIYIE